MTLTARLSLFFLGALALVLGGFSAALYVLAHEHLYRQADHRLWAALDTLTAAVEIEADQVEWCPQDRVLALGQDDGSDQVRWWVHELGGRAVGRSPNLGNDVLPAGPEVPPPGASTAAVIDRAGARWAIVRRCLVSESGAAEIPAGRAAGFKKLEDETPTRGRRPASPPPARPKKTRAAGLVLTAGLSLAPVEATLRQLAWSLGALAAGVWLAAALVGRWVCRRALRPLTRMAESARSIRADNLDQRLPVGAARDELAELGGAFNDLLGRLDQAFERQRRFTGDASHQLRTPLTAVLGQLEVALRRPRAAEDYRAVLANVHAQAGQLRQIVESLLFLARADAEARLPQLETISLTAWLPAHAATWAAHPRAADLHCACPPDDPLAVRAHAVLLGQLLDNLWDNACKYSPAGTPVVIRVRATEAGVELTFTDAGPGIAPEDLPHIFEPFYRAERARRHGVGGNGLGLAVAQRIVSAFGGALTAASPPGEGATIRITLPRAAAAPQTEDSTRAPAPTRPPALAPG